MQLLFLLATPMLANSRHGNLSPPVDGLPPWLLFCYTSHTPMIDPHVSHVKTAWDLGNEVYRRQPAVQLVAINPTMACPKSAMEKLNLALLEIVSCLRRKNQGLNDSCLGQNMIPLSES